MYKRQDVYYIEYPKTGGSWIAQMSAVGVKDVICSKTKLPKNWQNLSASKEGAVDMDGPTFYSLADSSNIVTLTDSSSSFDANGESADKKIKAVVIPSTVRKIGKEAFAKCKNLKKITIKTTYLSSKKVGANAFKGIHAKATIKVPKKQKKAYQKLFKARGIGKKVTVK